VGNIICIEMISIYLDLVVEVTPEVIKLMHDISFSTCYFVRAKLGGYFKSWMKK